MQLTLNQTWNTPPSTTRLGSSLIVGRDAFADDNTNIFGLAVNGGGDICGVLSADVNARWDSGSASSRTTTSSRTSR